MRKWTSHIILLFSFQIVSAQPTAYIGRIGLNMPVKFEIEFSNTDVSGSYSYVGQEGVLKLIGQINNRNEFSLNEFNHKGSISGEFIGKKVDAYLVGVWRKPDGRSSFTFLATESSSGTPESALLNDSVKIYHTLFEWSEAHNSQDLSKFESLFDKKMLFYSQQLDRVTVLQKKKKMFNKYSFFHHYILPVINIAEYENGVIKCDFIKRVIHDGKITNYPSYLLLKSEGERYSIIGESDLISDENLNFKLDIGKRVYRHWYTSFGFIFLLSAVIILVFVIYYVRKSKFSFATSMDGFFSSTRKHKIRK